jgi:dynein heavy chain
VHFQAEDPFLFAKRVAEAHQLRKRAESMLRYNLYVDSMPTDDIPGLTPEQINRMLASSTNSKRLREWAFDTSQLVAEVRGLSFLFSFLKRH